MYNNRIQTEIQREIQREIMLVYWIEGEMIIESLGTTDVRCEAQGHNNTRTDLNSDNGGKYTWSYSMTQCQLFIDNTNDKNKVGCSRGLHNENVHLTYKHVDQGHKRRVYRF